MFGNSIFISMKQLYFIISFLFLFVVSNAGAQDYILLPETFYPHKGDQVKMHLITANQFMKQDEIGFDAARVQKLTIGTSKKPIDLMAGVKPGDSTLTVRMEKDGINVLAMTMKTVTDDIERDDFLKILDDEGLNQFSEKAKNGSKDSFREKYTWYLKTLVAAGKPGNNDFDKSLGQDFEIIIKDNPYKGSYGDDIIALVNFHDKPVINATVLFYVKTADGSVFASKLATEKLGQVYFKLSREGIYMLRSLHMETSKEKNTDFDTYMANCMFSFSNSTDVPNSYKSFGMGDKH